jgi:Co/Zn/Cd efflux system component
MQQNLERAGAYRPAGSSTARLGAILLVVLGLLFLVGAILGMLPSEPIIAAGGLLFLGVLGLILGGAGIYWLRSLSQRDVADQGAREEEMVARLIARNGGTVTIPQLAEGLNIRTPDAEALAERLMNQRILQPELLDDGTLVYKKG